MMPPATATVQSPAARLRRAASIATRISKAKHRLEDEG